MKKTFQSFFLTYWGVFLLLLSINLAVYHNSLHNGFMIDDDGFFSDPKMKNIEYIGYQFIPDKSKYLKLESQTSETYYRPFAHVIPMLCFLAFDQGTFGFHITNLVMFTFASFLIYWFLFIVFSSRLLAVLTSILFSVHPINGMMVNYITASVYPFQISCLLLSLILLYKKEQAPHP